MIMQIIWINTINVKKVIIVFINLESSQLDLILTLRHIFTMLIVNHKLLIV